MSIVSKETTEDGSPSQQYVITLGDGQPPKTARMPRRDLALGLARASEDSFHWCISGALDRLELDEHSI